MRERENVQDVLKPNLWSGSDALVLQGLSGLAAELDRPSGLATSLSAEEGSRQEWSPVENGGSEPHRWSTTNSPSSEELTELEGFRSARELRAAQEREAAERRSEWRRREGVTQALGLRAPAAEPAPSPFRAVDTSSRSGTSPQPKRIVSTASSPSALQSSSSPSHGNGTDPASDDRAGSSKSQSPSSSTSPKTRLQGPTPPTSGAKTSVFTAVAKPTPGPASASQSSPSSPSTNGSAPQRASEAGKSFAPLGRPSGPRVETIHRRHDGPPSLFPAVALSLLLTFLLSGSLVYGFWILRGDRALDERIQASLSPMETRLNNDLRVAEAKQSIGLQALEEDVLLLRTSHEQFVRLNALEAAIYTENSRPKFDDLLALGRQLETGSSAEEFFQQTKKRIEAAYLSRLRQHPGLDVPSLFPKLGATQESSLSQETLIELVTGATNASGWDRARAAQLLRRFKGEDAVIAALMETMRDEQDLQVVFAAWESLLALTDYVPGAKGYSPADFTRWWSSAR